MLTSNGVAGAFVCGTTGEGLSLTTDERCRLAERWVRVAPSALRVIVHVGDRIPNLIGVKFTHEDLDDFGNCLRYDGGRYDMLFGRDELLLSALSLGCRGAVGSTYNFAAPLYRELMKAYDGGNQDRATGMQQLAVQMIQTSIQVSLHPIATFKCLMNRYVFDCGRFGYRWHLRLRVSSANLRNNLMRWVFHPGSAGKWDETCTRRNGLYLSRLR